jgi:hypothetical protein
MNSNSKIKQKVARWNGNYFIHSHSLSYKQKDISFIWLLTEMMYLKGKTTKRARGHKTIRFEIGKWIIQQHREENYEKCDPQIL